MKAYEKVIQCQNKISIFQMGTDLKGKISGELKINLRKMAVKINR